jgi:N-acetyl sugar amidotransferase
MNKHTFDAPRISYCTRCLEPTTRPDATFDEHGVCMPCRYVAELDQIDWAARRRELDAIIKWGREKSRAPYDCIIGVSGGKDSTRQAFFVRDELGLKPLLVSCAYPPEHQTERGALNLGNLAAQGFDIHIVGPAPRISKAMLRESFIHYGNLFRATELALYSSIPIVAIAQGIPLIFLGENPALAFGGNVGSLDGSANQLRQQNTLGGAELMPWFNLGFERKDLFWYAYPPDRDVKRAGLRMVYLGYYMKDFNDIVNSEFSLSRGLMPREGTDADPIETGSINPADALDEEFVHVNQFLKYLKLGFGKVTQQASVQVRYGKISREEALDLVHKYDGRCSERYIRKLCNYIDISLEEFWEHAGRHRNLDLWQLDNQGEWQLRYKPA